MSTKLFVGNLPFVLNEDDLRTLFQVVGTVTDVKIPLDRVTLQSRGFGFVEMNTLEEAQNAISRFNGTEVGGRNIKIDIAKEKSPIPTNKLYAKNIGEGNCILCLKTNTLYGFDNFPNTHGVCSNCIYSLYRASKPSKKY